MKPTKKPKAPWVSAFPKQAKALRPENTKQGGIKAMSQAQAQRNAVYNAINELYRCTHPYCEACFVIWPPQQKAAQHFADDTHHKKGRDGLLLFDVRYFLSVCRPAHNWIGDHPAEAKKLGLLQ